MECWHASFHTWFDSFVYGSGQLYAGFQFSHLGFPKVVVLWERGKIYRKNEHANSSQSVSSRISKSKESFIQCWISTNYEQPRHLVVEYQRIKCYWKSRAASNSSCMLLERDPCLRRAKKIVATEVGQVKQTVTQLCFIDSLFYLIRAVGIIRIESPTTQLWQLFTDLLAY